MNKPPSFVPSCLRVSEVLEQHFDTAFAAPDGVAKLRELILTLAMQGKLVEQDPNDPPASELLKEIKKERVSHEGTKTRRKGKELPPIKPEEVPYELPQGWEWVRLGDICSYIQRGKGPKYADFSTHRVISQKCVRWYGLDLEPARYIDPASLEKYEPIRFLRVGDLLWNSTGTGTIGRACLVPQDLEGVEIVADSHVTVVRPIEVSSVFLWRWIQSPTVQNEIEGSASGTTNQIELNTSTVINHLMPLPPISEQHRIVARIDQLMACCDALEKLRKEREEKRLAVHAAAIKQLLDATLRAFAPSREENSSNLRAFVPSCEPFSFLAEHFGELYTVKENVAELRKAILQLAVMGRLVPQDPNDPPASELLKEIENEKASHEGTKTRRGKEKPLPPIKPEEVPYQLPQGWEWVRVVDLTDVGTGSTPETTNRDYYNGNIPWYTSSATNDLFAATPDKFITEKAIKETNCKIFPSGSLIVAMYGQGKTRGQISEIVIPGATNQAVAAMVFYASSEGIKKYLKYFFVKIYEEIRLLAEGAAQPNLNVGKIKETLVPLPPLPEQHRIVARINQLMALCDSLDQQIDAATGKQSELLNAVMGAL